MSKLTDIRVKSLSGYLIPAPLRTPYQFGHAVLRETVVVRVSMTVETRDGRRGTGWGESPLVVLWGWPGNDPEFSLKEAALLNLVCSLAARWKAWEGEGHALEVGHAFAEEIFPAALKETSDKRGVSIPLLAGLLALAPFDLALHDAYGNAVGLPVYETYGPEHLNRDLAGYLAPADGSESVSFAGRYPSDLIVRPRRQKVPAWHSVGIKDPIDRDDECEGDPGDGYPYYLRDWILRDGLRCLKIKLIGTDVAWDYERIVRIGRAAIEGDSDWLTVDFNCTAPDVDYVMTILDRLREDHPRIYAMILYVEQPFEYELEKRRLNVHRISSRKPLFLDESAHDWKALRLGFSLGWNGAALKTCKTQTGALLSACWAHAHGMDLMVQDLTNPMLAMIPHALLAASLPTLMGLENNAPQFYPEVSLPEAAVHPGLYSRRNGKIDLSSLRGPGFGSRVDEIKRSLPTPDFVLE